MTFKENILDIKKRIKSFKGPDEVMYRGVKKKLDRSLENYYTDLSKAYKYMIDRKQEHLLKTLAKKERQEKQNARNN